MTHDHDIPEAPANYPVAETAIRPLLLYKRSLEHTIATMADMQSAPRLRARSSGIGPRSPRSAAVGLAPRFFLEACLGFLGRWPTPTEENVEAVPAWRVVGGRYRDYCDSPYSPGWVMERSADFAREFREGQGRHPELITLARIPALGLYVALEGKNRVTLFQRYGGPVPAVVKHDIAFPAPSSLRLVRSRPYGIWQLEHLDSNRRHTLPFAAAAVPLLEAYGVPFRTAWRAQPALVRHWRRARRAATMPGVQMRP